VLHLLGLRKRRGFRGFPRCSNVRTKLQSSHNAKVATFSHDVASKPLRHVVAIRLLMGFDFAVGVRVLGKTNDQPTKQTHKHTGRSRRA
jgi:hypothetical protein